MKKMILGLVGKNKNVFLRHIFPLLVISGIVFVFFWKVFLKDEVPMPGDFVLGVYHPWLDYKWGFPAGVPVKNPITADVVSFIYPMQKLAIDLFKSGQLPLWNPYILAGTPLLANFQSAVFSPLNIFYLLFDGLTAWSAQIIVQHILAAYFTFLLLRHWSLGRGPSFFGGIVYAFSGFNIIWSQWNGHVLSSAFIPLLILCTDRVLTNPKMLDCVILSLSLAFQALSGYPQSVFYTLIAIATLSVFRLITKSTKPKSLLFVGVFLILGFGLSSFQWLPGFELLNNSQRGIEEYPVDWTFLPLVKTITILAPDFFGNHATQNYWGPQDYVSNEGFVGVIAFILALIGIRFKRRPEVVYVLILLCVSLLLSFSTPLSLILWKSKIGGFQAASAHRALILFNLTISILAGFGLDKTLHKIKKVSIVPFLIPGIGLSVFALLSIKAIVVSHFYLGGKEWNEVTGMIGLRNLVVPLISLTAGFLILKVFVGSLKNKGIVVFALIVATFELFYMGWKYTPFFPKKLIFPPTPVIDFLSSQEKPLRITGNQVIPMNMRMVYHLESPEGYEAVYSERMAKFLAFANSSNPNAKPMGRYGSFDNLDSRFSNLFGNKYILARKNDQVGLPGSREKINEIYTTDGYKSAFEDKSVIVIENKMALPRAYMIYDALVVKEEKNILLKLLDSNLSLEDTVILEKEPLLDIRPKESLKGKVIYTKYRETESVLTVDTNTNGILFVSDSWFPGWEVYIDGKKGEILRADYAFRAVEIRKGIHEVKFIYRPRSFIYGLRLTFISIVAIILLFVVKRFLPNLKF